MTAHARGPEIQHAERLVLETGRAWRNAVCGDVTIAGVRPMVCDGENHAQECPVDVAAGDLRFAIDRLELLEKSA